MNLLTLLALLKSVSIKAETVLVISFSFPLIFANIGLPRSSKVASEANGFPERLKTGLFLYIEKNYSNLTRKEKKKVEISLLVSAISKQYADVFDNNNLFDQTK